MVLDISISPFFLKFFDVSWPVSFLIWRSESSEYLGSASILMLWYISIAVGMIAGKLMIGKSRYDFFQTRMSFNIVKNYQETRLQRRIFVSGFILFFIGFSIQMYLLRFALIQTDIGSVGDLVRYTAPGYKAETSKDFIIAQLKTFSYTYKIGIIMMIMSYRGSINRILITSGGVIAILLTLSIFGGRESIVLFGLLCFFSFFYGNNSRLRYQINPVRLFSIAIACICGLSIINYYRIGISDFSQNFLYTMGSLFTNCYLDDVTYMKSIFPEEKGFLFGKTNLGFITGFFSPGLSFPWFDNLYKILVDDYLQKKYYLTSGMHFSSAGEAFANFGTIGVAGFGLLSGLIFGLIFDRQKRFPNDKFFTCYAILASIQFFSGLPTKMSSAIVMLGFLYAVPIVLVKAACLRNYGKMLLFVNWVIISILLYGLYLFTGMILFKVCCAVTLSILTMLTINYLWNRSASKTRRVRFENRIVFETASGET